MPFEYVGTTPVPGQPVQLPVTIAQIRPVHKWMTLARYELLLVLVWFFVELARWACIRRLEKAETNGQAGQGANGQSNNSNQPDHQHVKFSSLSWAVLIGAAIGVLAYWLVVEVWAPGKFYSDQQVISRPVGALVQTEVPNQLSWSSSANKFVNAVPGMEAMPGQELYQPSGPFSSSARPHGAL